MIKKIAILALIFGLTTQNHGSVFDKIRMLTGSGWQVLFEKIFTVAKAEEKIKDGQVRTNHSTIPPCIEEFLKHPDFVKRLKELKNPETKDIIKLENNKGQNPFQLACKNGDLDCAKSLYELGIHDSVDYKGRSALQFACLSGNLELVKFLFEKKITVAKNGYISDKHAEELLAHACKSGNPEVVRYLMSREDVHSNYFFYNASADEKTVRFLLKHDDIFEHFFAKAFLNRYVPNNLDHYFFNGAIYCNYPELITRYLELYDKYKEKWMSKPGTQERDFLVSVAGTDNFSLSLYESFPKRIFEMACKYGNLEIAELVLPRLGKIDDSDRDCLYKACQNGHFHIAEFLFNHVNYAQQKPPVYKYEDGSVCDGEFSTDRLLWYACKKKRLDIIKFFIKHDNDIFTRPYVWEKALSIAQKKEFYEIIELLLQRQKNKK